MRPKVKVGIGAGMIVLFLLVGPTNTSTVEILGILNGGLISLIVLFVDEKYESDGTVGFAVAVIISLWIATLFMYLPKFIAPTFISSGVVLVTEGVLSINT